MEVHIATEGQDLFDVVLQRFGDLENSFDLLELNPGVDIDSRLVSGQELKFDNENLGLTNVKEFFTLKNFVVLNADIEQLTVAAGDYSSDFSSDYEK